MMKFDGVFSMENPDVERVGNLFSETYKSLKDTNNQFKPHRVFWCDMPNLNWGISKKHKKVNVTNIFGESYEKEI